MSYQVIARKWRPQTFEEVTGQEAITQTICNALEHDRLHHAYLFSGARGVGKTTTARLLAKALNCHKTSQPNPHPCAWTDENACASCREIAESRSIDVLEFDAASHTGVDAIREIILESINIAPARDRYKIFIIDEVHMLSNSSFNALLKTLEEPPPNVAFIMATTELHKVPETILSRCQEFEFRTIPLQKIFARLKLIAEAEKITITDEGLREIARSGEGSMRDAQSNFDQVISFSGEEIDVVDVAKALGIASADTLTRIITAVAHHQPQEALNVVDDLISRGHDLRSFCRDLLSFFRDLLIAKIAGDNEKLLETAILSVDELTKYANHFTEADLVRFFNSLSETEMKLRDATQSRYVLEIGLVKIIEMRRVVSVESLLERLAKLETALFKGNLTEITTEKKTLKVDLPLEEVPFPTKKVLSENNFIEKEVLTNKIKEEKIEETVKSEIADLKFQEEPNLEIEKMQVFQSEVKSEFPIEGKPKFENKKPYLSEIIAAMPVKLPPISSEDLEHFEDAKLDTLYENKLLRSGDNLFPILNAEKIAGQLIGINITENSAVKSKNSNGFGTAAAPAKVKPAFEIPNFQTETDSDEIPVLPENPTEAELFEYANKHPLVRKVLRTFRGKVIEVKKLS
jgi:DNA polymerase III subunit gamma/tau